MFIYGSGGFVKRKKIKISHRLQGVAYQLLAPLAALQKLAVAYLSVTDL